MGHGLFTRTPGVNRYPASVPVVCSSFRNSSFLCNYIVLPARKVAYNYSVQVHDTTLDAIASDSIQKGGDLGITKSLK